MVGRACVILALLAACAPPAEPVRTAPAARAPPPPTRPLEVPRSTLEAEGMAAQPFVAFTQWLRTDRMPIFSLLVSRHGKLVYELYTSSIDPDDAHYLMSVTKSVLSALVGVAVDRGRLPDPDATLADALPRALFADDRDRARLGGVTLRQLMGMQGFDASDPPRDKSPDAIARYLRFWSAENRARVAVENPLLAGGFQYNDATPMTVGAALQYATGESAQDFAAHTLFAALGFRNFEWMHQDPSGLDNAGYGLRLRPIDMQKFGLLYLARGVWSGQRVLPAAWVDRTLEPWNKSSPSLDKPDYGWFWWTETFGPITVRVAKGWKGQFIAIIPSLDVVLTMTGCIEDGTENKVLDELVAKVVIASIAAGAAQAATRAAGPAPSAALAPLVAEVHDGPLRFGDWIEYRMVPSSKPKARRVPLRPLTAR